MDSESVVPLQRSVSQQSRASSIKTSQSRSSSRSQTVRGPKSRKIASRAPSSSRSSIAASDKSLTSFPSFSPPRHDRSFTPPESYHDGSTSTGLSAQSTTSTRPRTESMVDVLTTSLPHVSAVRSGLFEDAPLPTQKIPGALHLADDEHLERLVQRHGAVNLIRQIAEDLAQRDAQLTAYRRRADERERDLRKIILECGLSNLDLETRLRAIEEQNKSSGQARRGLERGLTDLMTDAMKEDVRSPFGATEVDNSTIRAASLSVPSEADASKGTTRGWKELLFGTGTTKSSRGNSIAVAGEDSKPQTVIRTGPPSDRRPALKEDLFSPPDAGSSPRSLSAASSVHSTSTPRKSSLASLALRMVAGGTPTLRGSEPRGRASSGSTTNNGIVNTVGSPRTTSMSSARTSASTKAASTQSGPKALMAMRRTNGPTNLQSTAVARAQIPDRWDTMTSGPLSPDMIPRQESYGPVEMDTILPPEAQPPTFSYLYNNYNASEYLTDRFGFIYDQRRKKRQREAAQMVRHKKKGSRTEMLTSGRSRISPNVLDDKNGSIKSDISGEGSPDAVSLAEEGGETVKPKRWQDYLKIATFQTELLSHTPSSGVPGLEITEGGEVPKSPGLIPEQRGFVPSTSTTTTAVDHETQASPSDEAQPSPTLVKDDIEPVKLLLRQLSEVHDQLQQQKTVRWNDFLRKVRAERKRDREAEAMAAAAAAEARFQRASIVMPETRLADGEIIGVAGLGNKGKVGRAKWNEFRTLVLGGIPVAYRAGIWAECSGAVSMRIPGYYEDIVNRPPDQDDAQVVAQIRADITRTLTDNIFFRRGPGVDKLYEVLLAYARRNPEIGYCQGMNLIVANLLLVIPSAEDAFWILVTIIENILPAGYYDHSLLASRADQQVLRTYVSQVLPKLSQHFEDLSIDLETMTFQWFLSLFTDCLSAEALFRVWDVILCFNDGSTFLFQVALALLKLNEQQLLACTSPASIYTYINHQMTNHAISIDGLIQASEGLRRVVRREEVETRRSKAIEAEKEICRQREERHAQRRLQKGAPASSVAIKNPQGNNPSGGSEARPLEGVADAELGVTT